VFLVGCAALNAKHDQTQVAWFDVGVVKAVSDGIRWAGAVNAMTLEARQAFFLNRDNDFIAPEQTG
jgi:hypothetical protein